MPVDGDIILKAGLDTTGVSKQLDKLQKTVSKGLKNALRIGLGVRSVFALIRKLRTALFKGFENLAQVHEPFNRAMSDIMTSLNLLKNTFAAAFAPIIETVAPILTKFINMIAAAVSQIGQFIAALTGKEYVQAASVQIDYASSVNKSTASTNKATNATKKQTEAQKKLNKEITHFDDLVILHSDRDNDTDTSTTPAVTTPDYSFSTMPIGNAVSQFAKDFLAAWDKADFTDIGRKVGEKLKSALENIPWDKIKETLSKVAQSVATFLNGFFETPGLFTTIGKTIAEAINTAVLTANVFIRTFHWDSFGTAIRDKLIGVLTNIDWNLVYDTVRGFAHGLAQYLNSLLTPETFTALGQTVGNLIRAALIFLNTFGQSGEFEQFGRSVGVGISAAIQSISPYELWNAAKHVIGAIVEALTGFMESGGLETLATTFGKLIALAINDIDTTKSGILIALILFSHNFLLKLCAALILLAPTIPWDKVGQGIVDLIGDAIANFDAESITNSLHAFISGIATLLKSAIDSPEDENTWHNLGYTIGYNLVEALKAVVLSVPEIGAALLDIGVAIIEGILEGCGQAVEDSAQWITDNIFTPFVNWIKDIFGISSPATEMKPTGIFIAEGILEGVKAIFAAVGKWIQTNVVDPFISGLREMFGFDDENSSLIDVGKNIIGAIKAGIGKIIQTIGDWIQTNVTDKIIEFFQNLLSGQTIIDIGSNIIEGIKDGLLAGIDGIGTWIEDNVTGPINDFFTGFWEIGSPSKVYEDYGEYLIQGLQGGLKSEADGSKNFISTNVISKLGGFFMSLASKIGAGIKFWLSGAKIINTVKTGMTDNAKSLNNAVTSIGQGLTNSFNRLNFYNVGRNIAMGIYNGLLGYSSWLTTLAWNTAVAMYNSACRALSIASPSKKFAYIGEMVATGLGNGVADNQDVAVDAVTDMTKAMTDEAENANPSIAISSSIDTWIDDLDNVLTTFSDTVIDKFDNLVTVLAQLGNIDSNLPAIAQGRVIPSSIQASNSTNDNMSNVIGMLENLQSLAADRMDVSELRELLTEMFTRYMNFSIGDEQLARHANNGNRLLDRRYNTVRG